MQTSKLGSAVRAVTGQLVSRDLLGLGLIRSMNCFQVPAASDRPCEFRLGPFAYAIAGLAAMLVVAATLSWLPQHLFAGPGSDAISDKLLFYRSLGDWRAMLAYFVAPHNEHRILTVRVFTALDEVAFSGRQIALVVLTTTLQLASSAVVFALLRRWVGRDWRPSESLFALGTILVLFVNGNFLFTLAVPFQLQHAIMTALCVAASAAIARASDEDDPAKRKFLAVWLVLLALLATFTLANAPVILLSSAAMAVLLRWPPRMVFTLVVLAVLHVALIFATTTPFGTRSFDLVWILGFLLIYLGAPLVLVDAWPAPHATFATHPYLAAFFGAVILAAGVAFAFCRFTRPGLGGRLAAFGLAMLIMVVLTGLAGGLSRVQFGILEGANKKYASFAVLGWVGTALIVAGVAHQLFARHRRGALWPLILVYLIVLPLAVIAHLHEPRIWAKLIDRNWESASAIFAHVDVQPNLYYDINELREYVAFVEPRRRGLFAQFPARWGEDVGPVLGARRVTSCLGEVNMPARIAAQDRADLFRSEGTQLSVSGWTWISEDHAPSPLVLAIDTKLRIVGVATSTRASSRAEEWLGQKLNRNVGWFGYVRSTEPGSITFAALSRDGGFCLLGSRDIPPP